MSRPIALVATLALVAGGLQAADEQYQWEVGLSYQTVTTDADPEAEWTTIAADGTYHVLGPVALADHPWEEAAFLEHSSFVSATLGMATLEWGPIDADGLTYGVAGRYAQPDVPVAVDLSLAWTSVEDDDFDFENDLFTWDLRAGYWIMPNLIAGLGYTATSLDDGSDETTDTEPYVWGKWVHGLNAELDLNVEAELGRIDYDATDDKNLALVANGDVYFRKQYGVGLLLGNEVGDAESEEGRTVGIRGSAWFTPNIGVRAQYAMFAAANDDEGGVDSDTVGLEVVGRF